jgi:hypothetical protein
MMWRRRNNNGKFRGKGFRKKSPPIDIIGGQV